jgi:hypothetical protein
MKNLFTLTVFASLMCVITEARSQDSTEAKKDMLRFWNGDRIVGEVKSIQRGELRFAADEISDDITVKLKDIALLRAVRIPFAIEDIFGRRYTGFLDSSGTRGMVRILLGSSATEVYIEDLNYLHGLEIDFWKRLEGDIAIGFSYTQSSKVGRINGSSTIGYSTQNWKFQLNTDLIYTMDEAFKGIEKADMAMQGNYEWGKRGFGLMQLQFQRITELGVNARFQGTAGLGPVLIKSRRDELRMATGISVQQEYGKDSSRSNGQFNTELPLFADYYLFQLGRPELYLQAGNILFFSLSEKGRWRSDMNASLNWKIVRHLKMSVQVYVNYDSKPPGGNEGEVDFGIIYNIGYTF